MSLLTPLLHEARLALGEDAPGSETEKDLTAARLGLRIANDVLDRQMRLLPPAFRAALEAGAERDESLETGGQGVVADVHGAVTLYWGTDWFSLELSIAGWERAGKPFAYYVLDVYPKRGQGIGDFEREGVLKGTEAGSALKAIFTKMAQKARDNPQAASLHTILDSWGFS